MCNIARIIPTDLVLLGLRVAVTAPTIREAREYVTRAAQELNAEGHHIYHSISKVALDNGGTLEALTPAGLHGRSIDRVVTLGVSNNNTQTGRTHEPQS